MLDNIILDHYHACSVNVLRSSIPIQTQKLYTNLCSMVQKETVAYFVQNQNPVFCTFLASTEAFDRIN